MIGFWVVILMTVTWKERVTVAPPGIVPIGKKRENLHFVKHRLVLPYQESISFRLEVIC